MRLRAVVQSDSVICPCMGFSGYMIRAAGWRAGLWMLFPQRDGWMDVCFLGRRYPWVAISAARALEEGIECIWQEGTRLSTGLQTLPHRCARVLLHNKYTVSFPFSVGWCFSFNTSSYLARMMFECCVWTFIRLYLNTFNLCMARKLFLEWFFRHSFIMQSFKETKNKKIEHFLVLIQTKSKFKLRNTIGPCQELREVQTLKVIFPDSKAK